MEWTVVVDLSEEELDEVKLFGLINLSGEDIKLKNDCEAIEGQKEGIHINYLWGNNGIFKRFYINRAWPDGWSIYYNFS